MVRGIWQIDGASAHEDGPACGGVSFAQAGGRLRLPVEVHLGGVLPRVLGRLPYGQKTVPVDGIGFEEDVTGKDHKKYLWGNAAYVLGQDRTGPLERPRIRPDHDGESAGFGTSHSTAHRCIDEGHAIAAQSLGDPPRGRGVTRSTVDKEGTRA